MGRHLMRRPPKFVHGFIDRHGKPRFYFRRPGFKRAPLPGLPWSPEFMTAYEAALADQPLPVGLSRARPGTMLAVAISYFASAEFRTLRLSTQRAYRWTIDRICRDHGDKRAAELRREHIVRLMAARAGQPAAANALRIALRVMMKHAIDIGLRADDPTREVRAINGGPPYLDRKRDRTIRAISSGRFPRAIGVCSPTLYRAATRRRAPHGGATYSRRRRLREAGEDRHRTRDPAASGPCGHHCCGAAGPPYVRGH